MRKKDAKSPLGVNMRFRLPLLLTVALLPALAADWPQWRGPNRDGLAAETGLLKSWPAGGPHLAWKTQGLGQGYASFSIAQGRLFTQGQRGDQEFVLAFDVRNGQKLWETPTGRGYRESRGNGPRGTPTLDGDRLFALAADGTLVCLETATGKVVWRANIVERFHGRVIQWGMSESPLVEGDRLIVTPGARNASVVALDKRNGNTVWQSQSDEAGYSSVIAFDYGGTRLLALLTGDAALGLAASDGKLLWRYKGVANGTANVATPIYHDGHVFYSSDYGTGCVLMRLSGQGSAVKAQEAYFNRDMRNHYTSCVLVGEYLYGFSSSILTAMEFKSGKVAWRDRSVGKGNCIYAEGNLYCLSENGVVGLVEATSAAYREKSRFQIPPGSFPTWSFPAIADGKLFLREQDNLYCYDIK
jgi:outer membrane protein assembly factor BamB